MTDAIFIHPRLPEIKEPIYGAYMIPLGIAWIAAYLMKNNYSVKIIDYQVEDVDLCEFIEEEKPYLVGISGVTHTRFECFRLAKEIKKIDKNILVVFGGPYATFTAEDTLENVPYIDVIVRGEGEKTCLDLIKFAKHKPITLKDINGISYRENNKIVHNNLRERIKNLDELPYPARNLFKIDRYNLKMDFLNLPAEYIMTSRGCLFNCSFCAAKSLWGKVYTKRSAENVCNEIEELVKERNIKGFKIFDSTFTIDKEHVYNFCDELKRRDLNKLYWECEIHAATVNKDMLKKMKDAGCYYLDMGLESASQKVLNEMKKGIKIEQVENIIRWANEFDMKLKLFLTFGHIKETLHDAKQTIKFYHNYKDKIYIAYHIGIIIHPGTYVEEYAIKNNLLDNFTWTKPYYERRNKQFDIPTYMPILIQKQMSYKELGKIKYLMEWAPILNLSFILKKLISIRSIKDIKKILSRLKYLSSLVGLIKFLIKRR